MAEKHLLMLKEMIELLDKYKESVSRAQLEGDRECWLKVKAALELAIQCAIDLALWVISNRSLGVPQSYREAFGMLARAGLLDEELAEQMKSLAGLRNILVHVYTDLDLDRIYHCMLHTEPLKKFHAIASRLVLAESER